MPDETRIYGRFMMTESGQKFNAVIETLAVLLYREHGGSDAPAWTRLAHGERMRWRRIAEGTEDFPTEKAVQ